MPAACTNEDRFRALLEVARKMSSAVDFEALLREILISSQEVMCAEAGSIFLPDSDTGELIIHSASGDKAPLLNATRIPKGAGIAGSVYLQGKTVNIKDTRNDPRHYRKVDEKTGFETRAMITSPLLNGERCLGVVQVLNPKGAENFDDEDEEIFEGFAALIASTLVRLEAQNQLMSEEKRKQELTLARDIQHSFLPPVLQIFDTCQVRAAYFPARSIGGDFYFVHPAQGDRMLVGIADITGKGVPAALNMARATATIKAQAHTLTDNLGGWVSELNDILCEELHQGRFIGITFLLADTSGKTLQVCNAGQYAPLVNSGSGWSVVNCSPQLPVGIMPGASYSHVEVDLKAGQHYILYTDGITEARDSSGEEYTDETFIANLPSCATSRKTLSEAVDQWKKFMGSAEQHDDSTILIFDWRGAPPEPSMEMKCSTESLCTSRGYIENWATYCGFDDITVGQIVLAVDEAITNVYRYAYEEKGGPLKIEAGIESEALHIRLTDRGNRRTWRKSKGANWMTSAPRDWAPSSLSKFSIASNTNLRMSAPS
jgi:sigma-B regulation protein RsbU (phosphoserine phosphatase)